VGGGFGNVKRGKSQDNECKGMTTDQVKKVVKEECVKYVKKMCVSKKKCVKWQRSVFKKKNQMMNVQRRE
jgi:hypothetical protein